MANGKFWMVITKSSFARAYDVEVDVEKTKPCDSCDQRAVLHDLDTNEYLCNTHRLARKEK